MLEDGLLVCDRCHNIEEIVVALVQALPLRKSWALCGTYKHELPEGFHLNLAPPASVRRVSGESADHRLKEFQEGTLSRITPSPRANAKMRNYSK